MLPARETDTRLISFKLILGALTINFEPNLKPIRLSRNFSRLTFQVKVEIFTVYKKKKKPASSHFKICKNPYRSLG